MFTAYALVSRRVKLLIFGGRVADLAGQRRTFLIGLGLFTAASAGCALAWSPAALVTGRVLQGAGAALLSPAALALLTTLSEPGPRRRRAVGWWTAVAAGGGASGWVLGGLITEYAGWRWVFAVNVPVGLVAADDRATGAPHGSETDPNIRARSWRRLDRYCWPGAACVRADQCRRARPHSAFELAAAVTGSRRLRDLRTPRGPDGRSSGAAWVNTVSAGRWRQSDCSRHNGFNHACDVSFGPVRPGCAGCAGRTGVAAVPGGEPGRHRRLTHVAHGC